MSWSYFIEISQWVFLLYFSGINLGYLILNFTAVYSIYHYMNEHVVSELPGGASDVLPPVSLLVPGYNEEETIVASIHALLQLDYPEYEIIIINDGSKDKTIDVLIEAFDLIEFPEAYRNRIDTKPIRQFYRSSTNHKIRVIDKENGGKADAINVGINAALYPLFCTVDADSILQQNSLQRVVQPFLEDSDTIASGGTVRVVNGCKVKKGFLYRAGMPDHPLAIFQIIEYLRAFLFGRLGWSPMNALLIISGAFGVFHKETVVSVGGYRNDTVGEDMELVVRLHRILRKRKKPYRITFVPDPICWTEAPESIRVLARQRIRWQRGLAESLFGNISLLFNPRSGAVGFFAFPFMLLFECLGPVVEFFGYIIITTGYIQGLITTEIFLMLLAVAIGFGILLSITALLLEELSFHVYQKPTDIIKLFVGVVFENVGYRQLTSFWRMIGFTQWILGKKGSWGEMTRKPTWKQ